MSGRERRREREARARRLPCPPPSPPCQARPSAGWASAPEFEGRGGWREDTPTATPPGLRLAWIHAGGWLAAAALAWEARGGRARSGSGEAVRHGQAAVCAGRRRWASHSSRRRRYAPQRHHRSRAVGRRCAPGGCGASVCGWDGGIRGRCGWSSASIARGGDEQWWGLARDARGRRRVASRAGKAAPAVAASEGSRRAVGR